MIASVQERVEVVGVSFLDKKYEKTAIKEFSELLQEARYKGCFTVVFVRNKQGSHHQKGFNIGTYNEQKRVLHFSFQPQGNDTNKECCLKVPSGINLAVLKDDLQAVLSGRHLKNSEHKNPAVHESFSAERGVQAEGVQRDRGVSDAHEGSVLLNSSTLAEDESRSVSHKQNDQEEDEIPFSQRGFVEDSDKVGLFLLRFEEYLSKKNQGSQYKTKYLSREECFEIFKSEFGFVGRGIGAVMGGLVKRGHLKIWGEKFGLARGEVISSSPTLPPAHEKDPLELQIKALKSSAESIPLLNQEIQEICRFQEEKRTAIALLQSEIDASDQKIIEIKKEISTLEQSAQKLEQIYRLLGLSSEQK